MDPEKDFRNLTPPPRYIDANKIFPWYCSAFKSFSPHDVHFSMLDIDANLWNIPTADVRPVVRGKWRLGGYGQISDATVKWYDQFLQGGFLYCSVCKGRSNLKYNFCPHCGAEMRKRR